MKHVKAALLLIALVVLCSWMSLLATDAYWVGIHIHKSVDFGRGCEVVGNLILLPGKTALKLLVRASGGLEVVFAPRELARANGLITGILLYALLRRRLSAGA